MAADPDARSLRWGWIFWAIGTALLMVVSLAAPPERLPLMVVLAAALLLWPLWRGGRRVIHAFLDSAHAPWQGQYYEFDGRQIRILTDDTESLWFCAADVFAAIEISRSGRDPSRVRLAAGRDGLRHAPGTRLLCFTERGLHAWLERRTEPRLATFQRWLETQVIGPHHRKLELAGLSARAQNRVE